MVTKIKIPTNFVKTDITKIEKRFFLSLKKLKTKKVYGLLIQNCDQLLKKNGKYFYNFFLRLKKRGIIFKLGFSVYSTRTLIKLNKKFKYDIVQIPINIINQDFLEKDLLEKLKRKKNRNSFKIIFLQGLLLMNKNSLPKKYLNYKKYFNRYRPFFKKK